MTKIDLSGPLMDSLREAKKQYEKAFKDGNESKAKEKAKDCARIAKAIATNNPSFHDNYLKISKKWEIRSKKTISSIKFSDINKDKHLDNEKIYDDSNKNEGFIGKFRSTIEDLITPTKTKWDDVGGLQNVKKELQEAISLSGIGGYKPKSIRPINGILLYGPPGTGKTLLAEAAAGSLNTTFFNADASYLRSKWFGESSKLISSLYAIAKEKAPSIIFIDEIDGMVSTRDSNISDASKSMLSAFLRTMGGFKSNDENPIITIAATNAPWNLDKAAISRFKVRVFVSLPDKKACDSILKIHTVGLDVSTIDFEKIASHCIKRLYSGRDISALCDEAIRQMIREANPNLHSYANIPLIELKKKQLKLKPLRTSHFSNAFKKINPPIDESDIDRYKKWGDKF